MDIGALDNLRIGVATAYGKPYFRFVRSLDRLGARFDSLLPRDIPDYSGDIIFTTKKEAPEKSRMPMLYEETCEMHPAVIRGLVLQKLDPALEQDALVIGVDPGGGIGLSIFYYGLEIESTTHSSVDGLVSHMITVLAGLGAKKKIVKIGCGNMAAARNIGAALNLRFCSSFELEFVNEYRTSPRTRNHNQRGKRDRLSAKYISQRQGRRRLVLPLSITG